jgi:hypothetical protein
MPTPSEKAVWLAHAIMDITEGVMSKEQAAECIDTALNEARLEGARAMQFATVRLAHTKAPVWDGKSGFKSLNGYQPSKHGKQYADAIRALDPQQIINESMEK